MKKINFFVTSLLAATMLAACGDKTCKHVDENPKDHTCDLCGEKLSDHVDADNNYICDYCLQPIAAVKSISLDFEETSVKLGSTLDLSQSLKISVVNGATKEVTWSSSNTEIAEISDAGVLTGKATGEVTVRATSKFDESKFAEAKVVIGWDAVSYNMMKQYLRGAIVPYFAGDFIWSDEYVLDYGCITAVSENPDDLTLALQGLTNAGWNMITDEYGDSTGTFDIPDLDIQLYASLYVDWTGYATVDVYAQPLPSFEWPTEKLAKALAECGYDVELPSLLTI